jgi:hypothetical protein
LALAVLFTLSNPFYITKRNKGIIMTKQLIFNVWTSQFLAECDALTEGRDYFDIESQESVLDAYNADFN